MLAAAADYGPFAPVVGYAGAVIATGGALLYMWSGKMERWRPPDEDLPLATQRMALLLCGAGMVVQWYLAIPTAIQMFLGAVVLLCVLSTFCFLRYSGLLGLYVYIAKVANGPSSVTTRRVLGGRNLLPQAAQKLQEQNIDIQTLFEGAGYNPDLLWSRESRLWVKNRVLTFFILTLVLGTSALTGAAFATQVILTGKPAASVIHSSAAPGLDKGKDSESSSNK